MNQQQEFQSKKRSFDTISKSRSSSHSSSGASSSLSLNSKTLSELRQREQQLEQLLAQVKSVEQNAADRVGLRLKQIKPIQDIEAERIQALQQLAQLYRPDMLLNEAVELNSHLMRLFEKHNQALTDGLQVDDFDLPDLSAALLTEQQRQPVLLEELRLQTEQLLAVKEHLDSSELGDLVADLESTDADVAHVQSTPVSGSQLVTFFSTTSAERLLVQRDQYSVARDTHRAAQQQLRDAKNVEATQCQRHDGLEKTIEQVVAKLEAEVQQYQKFNQGV